MPVREKKGLGKLWERIRISYQERSNRKSYPSVRNKITQSSRSERFEKGVRRKAMTNFVDLRVGKTTPLSGRILDDPLTLQGTVLLRILVRGVPEQHLCRMMERDRKIE